jgi:large subunit ribosomal protein L30e
MSLEKEIKDAMKEKRLLLGSNTVFKNIKKEAVKYVIYSNNCSEEVMGTLEYYGKNFGVELKKFSGNSRQLGEICGKPFNIMLLGIKK